LHTAIPRPAWLALIVLLIALRVPSLVQPAGGDQGLYLYEGQRVLAGDVMYRDVWDQKPPGIAFLYALLWRVWPHESIVAAADLGAAVATACLLVVLGRRRFSLDVGFGAAAVFLLFGDPYLQRLSGIYIRGQCEPFLALAVTVSLVLLAATRARWRLVAAGVALAIAFWLKYNAAAYGLTAIVAVWVWSDAVVWRRKLGACLWIGLGFAVVAAAALAYFGAHGALTDLRLATIDYNLQYSNETYAGQTGVVRYVLAFPLTRMRVDMIWFLGGLGAVLLVRSAPANRSSLVPLAWLAGAVASIAINGGRSLPNYFVQAAPALALSASAGLATLRTARPWMRAAVAVLLLVAIWRVGADAPVAGLRLASLPGLVENVRYDVSYLRGRIGRDAYLARFRGQKHDALENERLVRDIRETTAPDDPIFVFGFSGGSICWKSERRSSSRFFWSRPVFIEFAAERPGYGSGGLLADLERHPPAVLVLQKEEWRSRDFFMNNERLRSWLERGYTLDRETPMFSVWRPRS
jgi:hypothetical protein